MKIFKWDEVMGKDEEDKRTAVLSHSDDIFAIMQLRYTEETGPMCSLSYSELMKEGMRPDHEYYETVYAAPLLPYKNRDTMLEEIYKRFNIEHPQNYMGHSLSVSDIVVLKEQGNVSFYYVDSVGFKELQEFMKPENYLKNAEILMEDDYGMIDGIINNGPSETRKKISEKEEKSKESVLEQLKGMSGLKQFPVPQEERDLCQHCLQDV